MDYRNYRNKTCQKASGGGQNQSERGQLGGPFQGLLLRGFGKVGRIEGQSGQGQGLSNEGKSHIGQSDLGDGPQGQVQGTPGPARGQLGHGQMGHGWNQPVQSMDRTRQAQQDQRALFEGIVSDKNRHLNEEIDGVHNRKTWAELAVKENEDALKEAKATIDALWKSKLDVQTENSEQRIKLREITNVNEKLLKMVPATAEKVDELKASLTSVMQTLAQAAEEKKRLELAILSQKELKKLGENFKTLTYTIENNEKIALDRVEVTAQGMERARRDFLTKLATKENENKELSKLLESINEELQTTSQNLHEKNKNCVVLEEMNCYGLTLLGQAKEEINALKLEVRHLTDVKSTLQTERQNTETNFAEKEREFAALMAELQRRNDELQLLTREQRVKVDHLEKAKHELADAAGQRYREDAEIRSNLDKRIQEQSTQINNMKTEIDDGNAKYKQTLEYVDQLKRETASGHETICQMERQISQRETLIEECKGQLNDMKTQQIASNNSLENALKTITELQSALYQSRSSHADVGERLAEANVINQDLRRVLSHHELKDMTTKINEDELRLKIQTLELNNKKLQEELDDAKARCQVELEAQQNNYRTLVKEMSALQETHVEKDHCYKQQIKDFECALDSQREKEKRALRAMAELSDCKQRIKHFEEIAAVADAGEMKAEIATLKEELQQKTRALADADQMKLDIAKLKEQLHRKESNVAEPDSMEDVIVRKTVRRRLSCTGRVLKCDVRQIPLAAPVKLVEPLAVKQVMVKKCELNIDPSDSESSEDMDFEVHGNSLRLIYPVVPSRKRQKTEPAEAAGSSRPSIEKSRGRQQKMFFTKRPAKPSQTVATELPVGRECVRH